MQVQISSESKCAVGGLSSKRHSRLLTGHPRPEALGSPAGFAVRPAHGLLWPHPSLWAHLDGLFIRRRVSSSPEVPQFTLPVCSSVPPPVPRQTERLHMAVPSSPILPSPNPQRVGICKPTIPVRVGRVTRLQSSLYATARRIACPAPARAFTSELAPLRSPPNDVGYNYAGNSQFPRPDFHRLDKQPYGLRADLDGFKPMKQNGPLYRLHRRPGSLRSP